MSRAVALVALCAALVLGGGRALAAPDTDAPTPAPKKPAKAKAKGKATPKAKPAPKPEPAPEPEPEPPPPPPPAPAVDLEVAPKVEPGGTTGEAAPPAEVHHDLAESGRGKRFYVRAGVARVTPLASSREMELADIAGPASLTLQNGPIAGSGASVDPATAIAAVVGMRIGTSGRWSLETLLGAPFTVKFKATGTLANMSLAPTALGLPTGVPPLGPDLGEATAAPPMLTLVYTAGPFGPIRPFAGAGASVLFAYNARITNPTLTAVSQPDFQVSPAPGLVLQGGLEANLTHGIYARLDLKFIAGMLARAEVTHIHVATPDLPLFGNVEVGTAKMSVWVNPFVVQGAIGLDF